LFTGIVEEVGEIVEAGHKVRVNCRSVLGGAKEGASIAVNGVCLTMVRFDDAGFWADLSPETLARTNLGALKPGSSVNLERPAAIGDRISGHIVQGHVDATADFESMKPLADGNWWLEVHIPEELTRYAIHKGSVTLDGVSLTIASLDGQTVGVAIIPHTYENTVIRGYAPGSKINLEVDLIAKYVEKLLGSAPR
jgi:riboflavin synthase